jgi:hypothetical protein
LPFAGSSSAYVAFPAAWPFACDLFCGATPGFERPWRLELPALPRRCVLA